MAQDRVLGEQIDLVDLSGDLAANPTAIGNLATGITSDPGATATLDADYVRRDGTTAMSGVLTVNSNIVVTGTVDGRDVALDGSNQDTHIGDTTLHFTVASINHQSITGAGTITHSSIDTHIGDATLHFTEASINHASIQNVGTNTHTVIDAHLAAAAPHTGHVDVAGDTMTGDLSIINAVSPRFNVYDTTASTIGARLISIPATSSRIDTLTNTGVFDAIALKFAAGGIVTFPVTPTTNAAAPTSPGHLTRKDYVDSVVGASNLEDLNDVVVTGSPAAVTNEILRFDGANWINSSDTGMLSLIEDITPQLGGNLDTNNKKLFTANVSTAASVHSIRIEPGDNTYVGVTPQWAGSIYALAGHGTGNNNSGLVDIRGGDNTSGSKDGGQAKIFGGRAWSTSTGNGGSVHVTGGRADGGGIAGPLNLSGGMGTLTSPAGNVVIVGGIATGTNSGGDVDITGGTAASGYQAGDVLISPGGGSGAVAGAIKLHAANAQIGQATLQLWNDTNTTHTTGNYVELKAPATVTNRTWTLPQDDPATANGQFLTTNASGVLSFAVVNTNLVADLTPQLGGDLDVQTFNIITTDWNVSATHAPPIEIIGGDNIFNNGYRRGSDVILRGGNGVNNNSGGHVNIYGGYGTNAGGYINIRGGDSDGSSLGGGWVDIRAGYTSGDYDGGDVNLRSGDVNIAGSPPGYGFGGDFDIRSGSGFAGGRVKISCGNAQGSYNGADVQILAGSAIDSNFNGGNLTLQGGSSASGGSGVGGKIALHNANGTIGQASLQFWDDTNTGHTTGNYVELKAPAFTGSPPVDRTWVLPQDDPTVAAGDFLTTDASGNLSFATQATTNITVDNFADTTDYTSGTTTQLTLSVDPGTENNISVMFDGVVQHHDQYSIVTTTLTFTVAIPLGTNNVEVVIGTTLVIGTPADGTVTNAKLASDVVKSHGGRITSAGATTVASAGLVITKPGTGSYLVTHNWGHVNYAPTATVDGTAVYVTIGVVGINTFEVKTYTDGTTTAVDAGFTFNVAEW